MGIFIRGVQPTPEEPDGPKKAPTWHPKPSGETQPTLEVRRALDSLKQEESIHEYVDPTVALVYLCKTDPSEWVEPFCEELALQDAATQKKAWAFLGEELEPLALAKDYQALAKNEKLNGETLVKRLLS